VSAQDLAVGLPLTAWQTILWRNGTKRKLESRFAAVRVRPANRDFERSEPLPEQWLLIEWPRQEAHPAKHWLGNLAADTSLATLVATAKRRWIIERDYEELKQELGRGHYVGRGWRGFHHHATLCFGGWVSVFGHCRLRVSDRGTKPFSPSARAGPFQLALPEVPPDWKPRGAGTTP
jgi:SRSO17 transposase